MSVLLTDATAQEIQLELIRRTEHEALHGEKIVASLMAHRHLWEAALIDGFGVPEPGRLAALSLIKLRDLPYNDWNVDTLYVLCPDADSAHELARIAEAEDWSGEVQVHDDREEVQRARGAAMSRMLSSPSGGTEPHAASPPTGSRSAGTSGGSMQ